MAFISKEDFTTHIYEENIDLISRDNDDKLEEAINTAIQKAKRSLGRYDIVEIFAATDKAPYAELITYIKDIAKYHFIAICNVNIDYEIAEKRYNAAIAELKSIKSGDNIEGWPLKVDDTDTLFRSGSSNTKFNHYF